MDHRYLGRSGLRVPVLSFGTGTFGGQGDFFKAWGQTDVAQARRLLDVALDAGVNLFDSADIYSNGAAESILGEALKGRARDGYLISTKPPSASATARTKSAPRASTCCAASTPRSSGWAPTTSTCSSCTASMRARRSRKLCPPSTIWSAPASCATSACRISPAGI